MKTGEKECMIGQKRLDIVKTTVMLLFIISPMFVLHFGKREAFLWVQIFFCCLMALKYNRVYFLKYPIINLIFLELAASAVSAVLSEMPSSYQKAAVVQPIMLIPLYFTAAYLVQLIKRNHAWCGVIIKAVKCAVLIQAIWLPVQLILYRGFQLDINDLLFVKILHMVENASFVRSWKWYPSGLSWHSATLAPLFVLGILLFKSNAVRALILVDSMLCGNSTAMIGAFMAFGLVCLHKILTTRKMKVNRQKLVVGLLLLAVGLVAMYYLKIGSLLVSSISKLWIRLFGEEKDASTAAHFGYYADCVTIMKNSSPMEVLFGYGLGCSGHPISVMYGRYTELASWAIECDPVNILVSRGVVGFIGYYGFLLYILIKGRRIDFRYVILMFTVLVQGLGYNIQFDYLFLIEIILYSTIKMKVNFFDADGSEKVCNESEREENCLYDIGHRNHLQFRLG